MRGRSWAAWLVSALAHALLGVWLVLRVRSPESARQVPSAPIEIEITGRTLPGADRSQLDRGTERSAPRPRRGAARDDGAPEPSGLVRRPAEPEPEPEPEVEPEPEGEHAPAAPPDLSFHTLSPDIQSRLAGPPPDGVSVGRPGRPSVDEQRSNVEREEDAVANVRAGRADPLLYDYLRGARVRFEDQARRIGEEIPIGGGQAVRGWVRGFMQRVQEIHRGDRVADEVRPDLRPDDQKQRPDLAAAYGENRRQAEAGAEVRRVEVCLDVAPGHDTTTTLRHGSGNVALDRAALDAFARSASVHAVPPDARAGRACYEVRLAVYRVPPLPGVSCDLELGPHGPICVWPLKKVISVTSQLLGVEYPAKVDAKGAAPPSSILRRAR